MVKREQNNNTDNLLEFKKIGFGKTGYVTYQFDISQDYQIQTSIRIDREMDSFSLQTMKEDLSSEERELVDTFIDLVVVPKKNEVCSIYADDVFKFEDSFLTCMGITISQDDQVATQFGMLQDVLRENHDSISHQNIARIYTSLEDNTNSKIYQKVR